MEINNSLEENQNEDDKGPFLSSDVKAIFKKRKEEKNKKGMKKKRKKIIKLFSICIKIMISTLIQN